MTWYTWVGSWWLFMIIVMVGLWYWQRKTHQSSAVDVAWSFGVGLVGAAHCVFATGLPLRRILIAGIVLFWALRLGLYVWKRVRSMPEDGRYLEMHQKWGEQAQAKLFKFYQFQAFGAMLFALPMLIAAFNPAPFGWLDYLGITVFLISMAGEAIADRQLHRFRSDQSNRGQVCRQGLWKYSRHPNYFFEWLHWWAYVLLGWGAAWGFLNLIFPLAMLYFILFVTGIPPTERQALKSRGDAYRDYQRTTSAFFPWFSKKPALPNETHQSIQVKDFR